MAPNVRVERELSAAVGIAPTLTPRDLIDDAEPLEIGQCDVDGRRGKSRAATRPFVASNE